MQLGLVCAKDKDMIEYAKMIERRQTGRRGVVGSNDTTGKSSCTHDADGVCLFHILLTDYYSSCALSVRTQLVLANTAYK